MRNRFKRAAQQFKRWRKPNRPGRRAVRNYHSPAVKAKAHKL